MTQAGQQTHLSKLDLFTPSPLHPALPPLPTGLYHVMGGTATMLSTPDVLSRSAYIHSLLGEKANDDAYMRVRPAAHERIIKHLNIEYIDGVGWWVGRDLEDEGTEEGEGKRKGKGPKSMRTEEGRRAYAERGLTREWEALGMEACGDFMGGVRGREGRKRLVDKYGDGGGESRQSAIEID